MINIFSVVIIPFVFVLFSCQENTSDKKEETQGNTIAEESAAIKLKTTVVVRDLVSPVGLENAGDGSGRLFILEQPGLIKILSNGKVLDKPFLDIQSKVVKQFNAYSERGLLGLAFHPQYKTNGRFFVYYSAPSSNHESDHKSVISEFKVSNDADMADAASERVIMEIEQPEGNHNGGQLAFGPDGFLYIGLGDGGGGGDRHGKNGNGQDLSTLLGKILRIDVDKGKPYGIPADNPFKAASQKKEIYAYGLRNPWRFSFDKTTNRLFCGDVGQNKYEEIDIIEKGKNYGWRYKEGFHDFDTDLKSIAGEVTNPIYEYDRSFGMSVTGGYVYNGKLMEKLKGAYIFGDWNGKVAAIVNEKGKWSPVNLTLGLPEMRINSFGQDEDNELYIAGQEKVGAKSKTGLIIKLTGVE